MIAVTNHAVERFNERGKRRYSKTRAKHKIIAGATRAKKVIPKKEYYQKYIDSEYFQKGRFVFVVRNNVVVTVLPNIRQRWEDA